jgi:hypothetical protein
LTHDLVVKARKYVTKVNQMVKANKR